MKKLKKLSLKKEIEREAEALEKEVSGRKDLDHITVSEDMEEALFTKKYKIMNMKKRAKSCIYVKKKRRYANNCCCGCVYSCIWKRDDWSRK